MNKRTVYLEEIADLRWLSAVAIKCGWDRSEAGYERRAWQLALLFMTGLV